ncbi:carcinoembryonic antigen-related cell adhesion molecule 16-like [Sceloporus undulatus]|uniref:carcinoembryonic antigen-related cell adhesion molecule 16-like n=1 Tax=Sceloporus undulatus TaxID=8520 RepID=UPI001C4D9A7C|nr:carcinoembryonic antigen-related cell adhesion molecule 16-like [Sceloporus undulatus]
MGGSLRAKSPSWLALLLAASILSCCFLLTGGTKRGTVSVTLDPSQPIEGQSVTLRAGGVPNGTVFCRWFRDKSADTHLILIYYLPPFKGHTEGEGYTGRETMDSDCSLHIKNLILNDTRTYIVMMDGPGLVNQGQVDLVVRALESHPDTRGLSTAAIGGIAVGCIVALVVLTVAVVSISRRPC